MSKEKEVYYDDYTGLDDGLAGSSEDAYDGDYSIQQETVGNKVINKKVGIFTPKNEDDKKRTGQLPSLDEKLAEAEKIFNEQFKDAPSKSKEKNKNVADLVQM